MKTYNMQPLREVKIGTQEITAQEAQEVIALLTKTELTLPAHYAWAGNVLRELARKKAEVEAPLKALKAQALKAQAPLKATVDALDRADGILRGKMLAYVHVQTAGLQKALQEGQTTGLEQYEIPDITGVSITSRTTGRITDPDLIPREYCSPDPKKLNAASKNGDPKIPGWEIIDTPGLAVRK